MKIPVIFIAVVVAVGASRPPRAFDSEYREFSSYVESPTPPSRPSFLRSSSRHESSSSPTLYSRPQSFADEESDIFSEGPASRPAYREGRIFLPDSPFSSSYFPSNRPQSFNWEGPSVFREGQVITYEYKGPPPPFLTKDSRNLALGATDKQPGSNSNNDHRTTKPKEEPTNQHHHRQQHQQHQYQTTTEPRQPLSFGGHSNYLSFGNHGLGFASVAGITSADINPLAVAQITSTTKAATAVGTSASTISMQSSSTSGIQVSQQHPSTNPTSLEPPTSAAATSSSQKIAGVASSRAAGSTLKDFVTTTPTTTSKNPSVTAKLNLNSTQTTEHQPNGVSIKYYLSPKTYDFRTITQELPAPTHGLLPIESGKQQLQLPDVKQNLLYYDSKDSYPFSNQQFQQQFQQQLNLNDQNSNNNVSPVRFSIPTTPISSSPDTGQIKLNIPALDVTRSSLALSAVPNNPHYYFIQSQEQAKPTTHISPNIPLGSFYLLPNTAQAKQPTQQSAQLNSGIPSGLQLQLNGFGGIEYLMSPSNPEQMRPAIFDAGKGVVFQEQYRPTETMLTKNLW